MLTLLEMVGAAKSMQSIGKGVGVEFSQCEKKRRARPYTEVE